MHGCKYGDKNCPVELGNKRQSYLCESCDFGWENTEEQNDALWQEIFTRFKGGTVGKLFGTRTYLVGAMDRVADGGVEWREKITPRLHELGVMVYNPCNKPIDSPKVVENFDTRESIRILKEAGMFKRIREEYGSIRTVDLRMVDTSDFIIANIDVLVHACGTYEEITLANRQKKPVLVHCEQGLDQVPNWLVMQLPDWCFFHNWDQMIHYLSYIDKGIIPADKRWVFFNMEKEIEAINRYRKL